jgi:hypothetical protein
MTGGTYHGRRDEVKAQIRRGFRAAIASAVDSTLADHWLASSPVSPMTTQVSNEFLYHERTYSVTDVSGEALFDPAQLGLKPSWSRSSCWRGYQAVFAVELQRLVLHDLHVCLFANDLERQAGPVIRDVTPTETTEEEGDGFNNHYMGLGCPLNYSGGLLLGEGFLPRMRVYGEFYPAGMYERVVELVFANGTIVQELDHSSAMDDLRERLVDKDQGLSVSMERLPEFMGRVFAQRYPRYEGGSQRL